MKKNICRILTISIFICLFCFIETSFAAVHTDTRRLFLSTDSMVPYHGDNENRETYETILSKLNQIFGENNNITKITKGMVLKTHIKIKQIIPDESGITFITKYVIQIGNDFINEEGENECALVGGGRFLTEPLTIEQLIKFGVPHEIVRDPANNPEPKLLVGEGESWDATIIISCEEVGESLLWPKVYFYVEEVYTEPDKARELTEEEKQEIEFKYDEDGNWEAADEKENLETKIEKALEWIKRPGDCLLYLLSALIRTIGDVFQLVSNAVAISAENGRVEVHWVAYNYNDLLQSELNEYTHVSENPEQKSRTGSEIPIQKISRSEYPSCFDEGTKIPVIVVDYYTLAANKIPGTDANFLDPNGSNSGIVHGTIWTMIRNFIANIIYALMYITAACLVTSLIWHGIKLVGTSFSSPQQRRMHIEGLEKFVIATGMMVGIIVISALVIYASEMFLEDISDDSSRTSKELPLRVYVEDAQYSFSTTPAGYYRYLSEIENLNCVKKKISASVLYLILAFFNLALWLIMFARMIIMMILVVIGFIIILFYVFGKENTVFWRYKDWLKIYIAIASIQLIISIANRLLIECIIRSS